MAWVTKDSTETYNQTPEPPREYTKKEKAAPERRFGTVIKKTSGNRAKISQTYFKIQGTYFKICALYFPFSPRGL